MLNKEELFKSATVLMCDIFAYKKSLNSEQSSVSFDPWPYFHYSSVSVLTEYVVKVKPSPYLQFLVISLIHISHAFINFSCLL